MKDFKLKLDPAQHRKLAVVSAAVGLSSTQFIRAAIDAAIETTAEHNELVAAAVKILDSPIVVETHYSPTLN